MRPLKPALGCHMPRLALAAALLAAARLGAVGLAIAAVALGTAAAPGAARAAAAPAYVAWFQTGEQAAPAWRISAINNDPLMVSIEPNRATKARKHVFVLYPAPSSDYDVCMTKILTVFEATGVDADFTVVNFGGDEARGRAALSVASAGHYDLIFAMGSPATAWLYDTYFGGDVPVVSVCSEDPVQLGQATHYDRGSGANFAFTSLNIPIEVQMAYLLELKPGLKNLAVLVDRTDVNAMQTQAQPIANFARQRGIRVIEIAIENPEAAGPELARLVPPAVTTMRENDPNLANSLIWITGSAAVFREIAVINTHADRVPVLSVAAGAVKEGDDSAVMSIGISHQSNAHLAALYAGDILADRRRVGDLAVGIVSPPDIAINFRKARAIGLEIPFHFFESASFVYDYDGRPVRRSRHAVRTN